MSTAETQAQITSSPNQLSISYDIKKEEKKKKIKKTTYNKIYIPYIYIYIYTHIYILSIWLEVNSFLNFYKNF